MRGRLLRDQASGGVLVEKRVRIKIKQRDGRRKQGKRKGEIMAYNNSVRPNRPRIGNVSASSSVLNQNISRSGFVKTLGAGIAGLGMAASGLGGVARAQTPPIVVSPSDWGSLSGETYDWYSQGAINDYVFNGTSPITSSFPLVTNDGSGYFPAPPMLEVAIEESMGYYDNPGSLPFYQQVYWCDEQGDWDWRSSYIFEYWLFSWLPATGLTVEEQIARIYWIDTSDNVQFLTIDGSGHIGNCMNAHDEIIFNQWYRKLQLIHEYGPLVSQLWSDHYRQDVVTIQSALDSGAGATVQLASGRFYLGLASSGSFAAFASAGSVQLRKEDVTLTGTNAKLIGGGEPDPVLGILGAVRIYAPGVTVTGLEMEGAAIAIFITAQRSPQASEKTIVIEGNKIKAQMIAIRGSYTGGWPISITANEIYAQQGIYAGWVGYTRVRNPANTGWVLVERLSPLEYSYNTITCEPQSNKDANYIWGWSAVGRSADWGNNGPVQIIGNDITIINPSKYNIHGVITHGNVTTGLSHCLISNNTVRGDGWYGTIGGQYGLDHQIIGNDFKDFNAGDCVLLTKGRETTYFKNTLGPTDNLFGTSAGIVLYSSNQGEASGTPVPLPTERCVLKENDYTRTLVPGLPGNACIQLFVENIPDYGLGSEIKNNLIAEWNFPAGTTMCTQVSDSTMLLHPPLGRNHYQPPWQSTCKTVLANVKAMVDRLHTQHRQRMEALGNKLYNKLDKWPGQFGQFEPES